MWYLFLDDIRELSYLETKKEEKNLKFVEGPWIIARSMTEALEIIKEKGAPTVVSFDHDLGVDSKGEELPSGFTLTKWLVEQDLNDSKFLPENFQFQVHSDNPVGKKNIEGYLNQYLYFKAREV